MGETMKTVWLLLVMFVSASSAFGAEAGDKTLDVLFIEGVDAFKASEWDTAMERLNRVLAADTGHTGALNYRARIFIVRREFDKAMADIDRAIAIEPEQYRFAYTKGLIYEHLGEAEKGIEWYTKALDLKRGFEADSLKGRIAIYMSLGDYEKARDDCNWLLKHEKTASNCLLRAEVLLKLDETVAAYWDYVSAASLEPSNMKPILGLGDFFLFHDVDLRQAIAYYSAALEVFVCPAVVRLHRGQAYAALEPPLFATNALEDFKAYIEAEPEDPQGYFERAKLYAGLDDREKALADIHAAIKLDPENDEYRKLLEALTAQESATGGHEAKEPASSEEEVQ